MSRNFEVKTKKALFLNGEQITDYDWDHFDIDNIHEIVVATDDEKNFALFNLDGDLLFEIESCLDYEIMTNCILIKFMYIDLPLYALVSLEGELLLSQAFNSIEKTENKDILKLNMADIIKGYYIISTGQIILNAEDFELKPEGEYCFFVKNKWENYKLVNDKYVCID